MADYLSKLSVLFNESHKGKQQFLDLLEVLNQQDSWEYEEIVSWKENVFQDFATAFDWDFDSFSKQLNRFVEDVLEFA